MLNMIESHQSPFFLLCHNSIAQITHNDTLGFSADILSIQHDSYDIVSQSGLDLSLSALLKTVEPALA